MKTGDIKQAIDILKKYTYYNQIKVTQRDLNIILDKIRFSTDLIEIFLNEKDEYPDDKLKDIILFLFKGQISTPILDFLFELVDSKLLWTLADETGEELYRAYLKKLSLDEEIIFTTAVELPEVFKKEVSNALITEINAPRRIIFDTNPSLIAGFTVLKEGDLLDYSFKNNVFFYLQTYVENNIKKGKL